MTDWSKRLENATNICIIVFSIAMVGLLGWRAVQMQSAKAQPQAAMHGPVVGTKVPIKGVDWTGSDKTLVMALSTQCHFCTDSAGFYQQLSEQAKAHHVRLVAVFPQPEAEAQAYMKNLKYQVTEVHQATLGSISVSGTPTLMLVDKQGVIQKTWVGRLQPDGEKEVKSKM